MNVYQPHTTDATSAGQMRARNAMRLKLWADPGFAHQWLCHPEHACNDGCDASPEPSRALLYISHIEAPDGTAWDDDGGWTTRGHGAL